MNETVQLFILGILATAVLASFGYTWRENSALAKRTEDELERIKALHDDAIAASNKYITREIQRIEQNFYEYKLHVANGFATLQHLRESETRTQNQLTDISRKLDRIIERREPN